MLFAHEIGICLNRKFDQYCLQAKDICAGSYAAVVLNRFLFLFFTFFLIKKTSKKGYLTSFTKLTRMLVEYFTVRPYPLTRSVPPNPVECVKGKLTWKSRFWALKINRVSIRLSSTNFHIKYPQKRTPITGIFDHRFSNLL